MPINRVLLFAGVAAVIASSSLMAQDTAKQKTSSTETITATGCLQAGTAPDSFTLTNVTQTARAATATGTSGAASASASATTEGTGKDTKYELVAEGGVNLKPHVGHKVEITGMPDMKPASGASTSATSASAGTKPSDLKKIKVTAIKHVAASCA